MFVENTKLCISFDKDEYIEICSRTGFVSTGWHLLAIWYKNKPFDFYSIRDASTELHD